MKLKCSITIEMLEHLEYSPFQAMERIQDIVKRIREMEKFIDWDIRTGNNIIVEWTVKKGLVQRIVYKEKSLRKEGYNEKVNIS